MTRSWWGWGSVEEAVTPAESEQMLARVREFLPGAELSPHDAPDPTTLGLRDPRVTPPASLAGLCSVDPVDRAGHATARRSATSYATCTGDLDARPRPRRPAAHRAGRGRPARLVQQGGRRRRSPTAAAARSWAASSRASTAPRSRLDLGALDQVLEIDTDEPRRPDPGRRLRPAPRGPAPAARPDPAALPAVVRVLHPRRLAGHPGRWSLRHPLHPHRRPHRVDAGGHAGRASSESRRLPGVGRRAVAGPAVPRLRGHPRRDHRGLDAAAGPAALAGHRLGRRSTTTTPRSRRRGRSRSPACSRPTAGCSTRPRRSSTPVRRSPAACWCWRSSRPTTRSTRGWTGPWRSSATTAASALATAP